MPLREVQSRGKRTVAFPTELGPRPLNVAWRQQDWRDSWQEQVETYPLEREGWGPLMWGCECLFHTKSGTNILSSPHAGAMPRPPSQPFPLPHLSVPLSLSLSVSLAGRDGSRSRKMAGRANEVILQHLLGHPDLGCEQWRSARPL